MKQNAYCTEVGVLPGTDFRLQPNYMDMLNLQEAWQFGRGAGVKVAVIDTGVNPHSRFPHLIPGGDYVMAGDGLSDCDAHGTIVASMIGAAPANGAAAPPAAPRKPVTIPTTEPPPKAPPPQTVGFVTIASDRDDGSAHGRTSARTVRNTSTTATRRSTTCTTAWWASTTWTSAWWASTTVQRASTTARWTGSVSQPRRRHGDNTQLLRRGACGQGRRPARPAPT